MSQPATMASDDEEEYEYEYSDDDDGADYDDADADDDAIMANSSHHNSATAAASLKTGWHTSSAGGNPNAAPMSGGFKSGIRMLPSDELVPEMKRRLKDVMEVLDIPAAAAMVLLRNHKWSKEALLEVYYSSDKLLKDAGVYFRCNPRPSVATNKADEALCGICFDGMTPESSLRMPCGHVFCKPCWTDFCSNAIQDGPACVQNTTCPQASCNELVTEVEMKACLDEDDAMNDGSNNETELLQKYFTYQLRSFVESNKLTRWCPGKGCEFVACATSPACLESIQDRTTQCVSCTTSFCVVCGEEPHAPCACKEVRLWKDKCRNESETANWILANTKSCPKCVSRIEKNQGCNHMTCGRCSHEFCWICMGDWSNHGANTGGYYKCNKFNSGGDGGSEDQSEAARAKRELDRYLHYYKRYHAHDEAEKFARKQLKETEARMVLLQESSCDAKWSDVEFLKAANEQLVECRHVLKYTYAYAYYFGAKESMQKERFEHHQEMLERFTENLSELSEKPIAQMDRTDVVNQTRVVDRFMRNILKYVEDGMDDA